jgi:hypothetical protein
VPSCERITACHVSGRGPMLNYRQCIGSLPGEVVLTYFKVVL